MGAMLVGMITGGIAWICFIAMTVILAAIVFIDAYRHKMKAWIWAVMVLLFNFYALPVYIVIRIKIARLKCGSCGAKIRNAENFCTGCGNPVKKIDDGKIAKKVILYVLAAYVIFLILGMLYISIITALDITITI
ncbi:MAG: zinc ribbon domain-containing protein [Clostridia bacterium]|nr:zinc ribbon domain-containing protein [Clostridia bacterium]